MKFKDSEIKDVQLCEGENIKIILKDKELFISAPEIKHTKIKAEGFSLFGNEIEIVAGRNIHLTTAHPNILTIGCDFDKEKATIARLEKRIENLERVIAKMLKDKE